MKIENLCEFHKEIVFCQIQHQNIKYDTKKNLGIFYFIFLIFLTKHFLFLFFMTWDQYKQNKAGIGG
jgi:hypothetical protein